MYITNIFPFPFLFTIILVKDRLKIVNPHFIQPHILDTNNILSDSTYNIIRFYKNPFSRYMDERRIWTRSHKEGWGTQSVSTDILTEGKGKIQDRQRERVTHTHGKEQNKKATFLWLSILYKTYRSNQRDRDSNAFRRWFSHSQWRLNTQRLRPWEAPEKRSHLRKQLQKWKQQLEPKWRKRQSRQDLEGWALEGSCLAGVAPGEHWSK